jgi:hypothetical protein
MLVVIEAKVKKKLSLVWLVKPQDTDSDKFTEYTT